MRYHVPTTSGVGDVFDEHGRSRFGSGSGHNTPSSIHGILRIHNRSSSSDAGGSPSPTTGIGPTQIQGALFRTLGFEAVSSSNHSSPSKAWNDVIRTFGLDRSLSLSASSSTESGDGAGNLGADMLKSECLY
jgi:hypothetical protein